MGVAGSAIFLFWLAETIDAEPLLACVMAGIVSANRYFLPLIMLAGCMFFQIGYPKRSKYVCLKS